MPLRFKPHDIADCDCPHWLPDALDPEPEQCWCLVCGEPLPCVCATPGVYTALLRGNAS